MDSSNLAPSQPASYYVEQRTVNGRNSLSWDLARHAYARAPSGRVLILADNPTALLASFKKQWLQLCRRVQRERASTFNPTYIAQFTRQITVMQALQATAETPYAVPDADLYILTPAGAIDNLSLLPHFRTLYITCYTPDELMQTIADNLSLKATTIAYPKNTYIGT